MNKNQRGTSHILLIGALFVFLIIGFAAVNVINSDKSTSKKETTNETTKQETATNSNLETYKNEEAGITFTYPKSWKSEAKDTFRYHDGAFGGVGGTVTAPDNTKLTWVFQTAGGKGGSCEPAAQDVPFVVGNQCPSKQIISVEKAQSIQSKKNEYVTMFKDSMFITKTKYMGDDNKITYQICLDPFYTSATDLHFDETPEVGTRMSLLFPCELWDTGFNVKYEVKDETDFDSANAKTAQEIMKSFNAF